VIIYVDLGLTEEVEKTNVQFKHLLKCFATLPRMAIACRLVNIEFKLNNYQIPPEIYKELNDLCQSGPFYVDAYDQVNGVLNVKIYDADQRCLNDIVVKKGLAVYIIYTVLFVNITVCLFSLFQVETMKPSIIATENGGDQRYVMMFFYFNRRCSQRFINHFFSLLNEK